MVETDVTVDVKVEELSDTVVFIDVSVIDADVELVVVVVTDVVVTAAVAAVVAVVAVGITFSPRFQ